MFICLIFLILKWHFLFSDALLCPASIGNPAYNGSRHVLYVEVISVVRTDEWEQFCQEVALEWMKLDGVPHLAKQWDFIPGINKHINEVRIKTRCKICLKCYYC